MLAGLIGYLVRIIVNADFIDRLSHLAYVGVVTIGQGSRLYRQTRVFNMSNKKKKIRIGSNSHIRGELLIFPYGGEITIGDWCYIGEDTRIWSGEKIIIGNNVGIAHNVNIVDFSHEINYLERAESFRKLVTTGHPKEKGNIPTAPIVIEDHVAIYPGVIIGRGIKIGEGSIIAAGSVVLSDVPPFTMMMGNPARAMMKIAKDNA